MTRVNALASELFSVIRTFDLAVRSTAKIQVADDAIDVVVARADLRVVDLALSGHCRSDNQAVNRSCTCKTAA